MIEKQFNKNTIVMASWWLLSQQLCQQALNRDGRAASGNYEAAQKTLRKDEEQSHYTRDIRQKKINWLVLLMFLALLYNTMNYDYF